MDYKVGDIVWCRTKFLFINEASIKRNTIIKSEVHFCIYKAILLEINDYSVIYSSIYLKNLFRLPDKNNAFETLTKNVSKNKNSLYDQNLEKGVDIFQGVSFILPKTKLRDWLSEKLGLKDYFDKIMLEKYKEKGSSFDIKTVFYAPMGEIEIEINTDPIKYTEMPMKNWLNIISYDNHHRILSYLRKAGLKKKYKMNNVTIHGVSDIEGCINGYSKVHDLSCKGQFLGGVPHGLVELSSDDNTYYFKGIAEQGVPKKGKITYEDGTVFKGNFDSHGEPQKGKIQYSNGVKFEGKFQGGIPYDGEIITAYGKKRRLILGDYND